MKIPKQVCRFTRALFLAFACVFLGSVTLLAQSASGTDWPTAHHDAGASRFSPLAQINTGNVRRLGPVWTYPMADPGPGPDHRTGQSVPLVIHGRMYLSWPYCHVAAIEPETGKQIWQYTAVHCAYHDGDTQSMRSVAYWPGDKTRAPRILFGTEDGELYAIDARTGKPVAEFGDGGIVNLKTPEVMNGFPHMHYGLSSAPFVYKNLIVTGSHILDETGSRGPAGDVRAWDARTGKLAWTFHTVPRPGEANHETWPGDSWKGIAGANVWGFFSADAERGILYLPLGSVNEDFYGTDRPGPNLYADSIAAVDANTGKLLWHFQAVHHDLWDYDMPATPVLLDVMKDGKKIPAITAITKNPLLFILDRVTGEPIYGVEERPVPKGNVAGEHYSPTQPFPLKPPPLARQGFTEADFAKISPEQEAYCRDWYKSFLAHGGQPSLGSYTPPSAHGTLSFPTNSGGAWLWGGAYDPSLGYYIINTESSGELSFINKLPKPVRSAKYADPENQSPILYSQLPPDAIQSGENMAENAPSINWEQYSFSYKGMPCWQGPWGMLTAVDVNTGDIAWQVPYGTTRGVPDTMHTGGANTRGGPSLTAGGLIFIAGNDKTFRAIETKTGKETWSFQLPKRVATVPIIYRGHDGKEYVSIVVTDRLMTFALDGHAALTPADTHYLEANDLPEGPGRDLTAKTCSACHSVKTFTGRRATRADWSAVVQKMAQYGASASNAEFGQIIDYLSTAFPAK